jgi:hypothetical protein
VHNASVLRLDFLASHGQLKGHGPSVDAQFYVNGGTSLQCPSVSRFQFTMDLESRISNSNATEMRSLWLGTTSPGPREDWNALPRNAKLAAKRNYYLVVTAWY